MSKYTKEEQEFLDKAAIATTNAMVSTITNDIDYTRVKYISGIHGFKTVSEWIAYDSYKQAEALLTERKKLYESNNNTDKPQVESVNYCNGGCGKIIPDGHRFCSDGCTKAWAFD